LGINVYLDGATNNKNKFAVSLYFVYARHSN